MLKTIAIMFLLTLSLSSYATKNENQQGIEQALKRLSTQYENYLAEYAKSKPQEGRQYLQLILRKTRKTIKKLNGTPTPYKVTIEGRKVPLTEFEKILSEKLNQKN